MSERRQIVSTSLGHVHLRSNGEGGVPLVLLHMSPRSSQMWMRLQAVLPRTSVAVDRPGYGFSDAPEQTPSLADYAEATLEAVSRAGVTGRFDVLGMHTGSLEAIELAHLAPGRVRQVAIVAIPVFNAAERAHGLATFAQLRTTPSENGEHLLPAWRARFQFRSPPFDLADVQRRYVDYLLAPWPGQAYESVFGTDCEQRLRALGRPVIAFAPRDDVYEITTRSRPLLPAGSQYIDLPDCDIDLFHTRAAYMAQLIEKHLTGNAA